MTPLLSSPAPQEAGQQFREGKPGCLLRILVSLCSPLLGDKGRRGDTWPGVKILLERDPPGCQPCRAVWACATKYRVTGLLRAERCPGGAVVELVVTCILQNGPMFWQPLCLGPPVTSCLARPPLTEHLGAHGWGGLVLLGRQPPLRLLDSSLRLPAASLASAARPEWV